MVENKNPLTSLVIPTYGREESLIACLQCAIKQDYKSLEVLVIDQTETHAEETIKFLYSIRKDVRIIHHSPPSAVTARNRGFKEAQGDLIIFIDDDTTFDSCFVDAHVAAYQRGADVIQGRVIEPGRGVSYRAQWVLPWLRVVGSNTYDQTSITNTITGCNFSISRRSIQIIGEFDTNFTGVLIREDADYGARCHKAGLKMVFDADACLTHHRDSVGGVDANLKAAVRIFDPTVLRNELYFARKHYSPLVVWQYKLRLSRRLKRARIEASLTDKIDTKKMLQIADKEARNLLKRLKK